MSRRVVYPIWLILTGNLVGDMLRAGYARKLPYRFRRGVHGVVRPRRVAILEDAISTVGVWRNYDVHDQPAEAEFLTHGYAVASTNRVLRIVGV
jgi:hypothetical protein